MSGHDAEGIVLIAAVAHNGVIGNEGTLPWSLPEDMSRFRRLTMGRAVIMGRKTFESIGRPLDGRTNIVLTRQEDYAPDGVTVATSPEAALEAAADVDGPAYVIGGEQVYQQFMGVADRLELSLVGCQPEGDAVFPAWDHDEWVVADVDFRGGEPDLIFVTLERAKAAVPVG